MLSIPPPHSIDSVIVNVSKSKHSTATAGTSGTTVAGTSDHRLSATSGDVELGHVPRELTPAVTRQHSIDNRFQERAISQSVRETSEKSRVLNDWLLYELLSYSVSVEQAILCVDALGRDGVTTKQVFEAIPADSFTRQYLAGLGITSMGLQQHLLLLHKSLQVQPKEDVVVV